jgi:hypothetical protein
MARYSHVIFAEVGTGPFVKLGATMGEVIQFVPRSELERNRLIQEARANYERIFPSADQTSERQTPKK